MSFFFNESKKEDAAPPTERQKSRKRGEIPIASLRKLGCDVCPRDKSKDLVSPKMAPSGRRSAMIYLLGSTPSEKEDERDEHWCDPAGRAITQMMGREWMEDEVRSNYITQCRGDDDIAAQCCRNRIVEDIEDVAPFVIIGIGDDVLRWAVPDLPAGQSCMVHRGTMFAVKIGKHSCWFMPILYPNFVFKESKRKSEYEIVTALDIKAAKKFVSGPDFKPPVIPEKPYDTGIEIITGNEPGDFQRLEKALARVAREIESGIDLETTGLRVWMPPAEGWGFKDSRIICAAVGTYEYTVAFAIGHPEGWGSDVQIKRVMRLFGEFLLESGTKYAHNLAMEMEWLSFFFGNEILRLTEWGDTMALGHSLDERAGTKSLETRSNIHFAFNLKKQSNVDSKRLWEYPLRDVLRYNGLDTKWTDALRRVLKPMVQANPIYWQEYERKVRTASALVILENLGMPMDAALGEKLEVQYEEMAARVEAKIQRCPEVIEYKRRFGTFDPGNANHVLKLLKEICRREEIKVIDKRTGKMIGYTTGEDEIASIPKEEVPSVALILEKRGLEKMVGTYLKPVTRRKIVCVDGKLRSKYSTMVAETGRFSSDDPNAQNWPKRKFREVRGIICAEDGEWMLAADYGQIEFRVVGMASGDKNLVKYCWTGYDVHLFWAERMVKKHGKIKDWIVKEFEVDWDEKGIKTLRQEAKNKWVFPQLFGSSLRSCAAQLHLPLDTAEELGAEFWDEFSGVLDWQEKIVEGYERHGYVETLDGRRRRGAMTKNQIINHPIQGTAATIVCTAMNALSERALCEGRLDRHPRFNGHDDLSFFMPDAVVKENIPIIAEEMCRHRFDFINVPLLVEVSLGERWSNLEEIGKYRSDKIFGLENPYA